MSCAQNSLDQKNRFFIKYQPKLKEAFGSSEAVLIFQKSEYWSVRYPTGFWKFIEPCAHPLYKVGDSWTEELKISRKVFRRAFSFIGTHYKSKSAYLVQSDPFQGKLYASYYDRKTNRTYFLRNHQGVQDFLSSLWQGVKKMVSKIKAKISPKVNYRGGPLVKSFVRASKTSSLQRSTSSYDAEHQLITDVPPQVDEAIPHETPTTTSNQPLASSSCDVKDSTKLTLDPESSDNLCCESLSEPTQSTTLSVPESLGSLPYQSPTHSLPKSELELKSELESELKSGSESEPKSTSGLKSESGLKSKLTPTPTLKSQSTSLPSTANVGEEIDKNIALSQDMLKIWNDVTTNKQTLRSDLRINLPQALSESFQGSLELWTKFCLKVASSKFLMGEAPNSNFKAYLAWLIKPQTIADIEDKYYSLGDRQVRYHSTSPKTQQTFSRDEVQGTENWKDVCEQLCNKLGYATFKSWFKDIKFFHEESPQPTLHCPTRFMRDWVQTHYQSDLERIVKQVLPHTTNLTIGVGL